jgi:hypothetical protein
MAGKPHDYRRKEPGIGAGLLAQAFRSVDQPESTKDWPPRPALVTAGREGVEHYTEACRKFPTLTREENGDGDPRTNDPV